jgi:hypothetical protein
LDLRDLHFKDFQALTSDASHSDYGGPSTDYTFGHSSPEKESPAGSPAAYSVSLATAPTALRFIDIEANISLEAHRFEFVGGSYTRFRNPIHVKGIDINIHGYGLVEPHLAYQDGHSRLIRIRATHVPGMSKRGAPSIIPKSISRNGTTFASITLLSDNRSQVTPMATSSSSCTTICLTCRPFTVSSLPSLLTKVLAPCLLTPLCGPNALVTLADTP